MMCHLSAFVGWVFPFGNLLGPLVFWLAKRCESKLVDDQGKESLNFQISMMVYAGLALVLGFFLFVGATDRMFMGGMIGVLAAAPFLLTLTIFQMVFVVIATSRSSQGKKYRYPFTIRFIK